MTEKVNVVITVNKTTSYTEMVEMTKEEWEAYAERLDNLRGFEEEVLAEEIICKYNIDFRYGDDTDFEVDMWEEE